MFWYLPTEYTYDLAPPDAGTGNKIKFLFGVYLYEWIWDSINFKLCELGQLPDYRNRILTTHLLTKDWMKTCSQPEYLDIYFTKARCSMSYTVEDSHLIFTHNFSSENDFFIYSSGYNNVVGLIQNN